MIKFDVLKLIVLSCVHKRVCTAHIILQYSWYTITALCLFVCAADWCNTHNYLENIYTGTPYNGSEEAVNHVWRLLQLHDDICVYTVFLICTSVLWSNVLFSRLSLSLSLSLQLGMIEPIRSLYSLQNLWGFLDFSACVVLSSSTHLSRPACQLLKLKNLH